MRITKRSFAIVLALCLIIGLMIPTAFAATTGTGTIADPIVCETIDDLPATMDLDAGETVYITAPVGGSAVTVSDAYGWAAIINTMTGMAMGTEYDCSDAPAGYNITFAIGNQNPYRPTTATITVGAPAPAELGSQENPNADTWFAGASCYLMNTDLVEGDNDGYWYSVDVAAGDVLYVETSSSIDYEVIVNQGANQMLASEGNPIITYRATENETILIQVIAEPDVNWNYPAGTVYASAFICDASEENPVPVKSTDSFKVPVASGDTVYIVDNSRDGSISESGLVISGYSEAIALATVTVNGVEYTDTDGDGTIELNLEGGYYNRPVVSIENGHEWSIPFTVTVVESAVEGDFCTCGNKMDHIEAVEPCHVAGIQEYWYCGVCDVVYADRDATQVTNRQNLTIPADSELVHVPEAPACHANGVQEYWYCPDCEMYYTDAEGKYPVAYLSLTIPATVELVHMEEVEACHADGMAEYWFCPECEAVFSDAEGKYLTNRMNLVIPADCELTHVEAYESVCHQPGMLEHWYCEECGAYFTDAEGKYLTNANNLKTPVETQLVHMEAVEACHANGMAEYWFCPDCQAVFADALGTVLTNRMNLIIPADCELVHMEEVEACHADGMAEYWFCPECEAVFSDAEGKYLTNRMNLVIPADCELTHVEAYESVCHQPGMQEHWYCVECGAYYTDAEGKYLTNANNLKTPVETQLVHMEAVEACHANGMAEYWFCPDCQIVFADALGTVVTNRQNLIIPADSELVYVPATEACHVEGCAEYWYCPDCEAVYADAEGKVLTNRKNLAIAPDTELVYVPAAEACHVEGCAEYWYCPDCEAVYADAEGKVLTNRKNLAIAPDTELIHMDAVDACHNNGTQEYWYCPDCEAVYADAAGKVLTNRMNLTIPGSLDELKHVDAVAPTATENGVKEHWYCEGCDCYFTDAEGKYNVAYLSLVIPATGETETPKTGDSIMLWVVLATVSVMGLACVVILNKKKFTA